MAELEFEVGDYSELIWGDLINAVVVVGSNQEISPSKGLTRLAQKVWEWMSITFNPSLNDSLPFYLFDVDGKRLIGPMQEAEGRFFCCELGIKIKN